MSTAPSRPIPSHSAQPLTKPWVARVIAGIHLVAYLMMGAGFAAAQTVNNEWDLLLQSPLRLDKDLAQDPTRKPLELLSFAKVKPGWRVMDVYSGGGYTAQLMALAVTPSGKVFAQTDKPSKSLEERLSLHPQNNIELLQRPMDDLAPPNSEKLDLITLIYSYHDIAYMPIDRLKMDKSIDDALKYGGLFVIIDHSAQEGSGLRDIRTLHRIDKKLVIQDFLSVGFKLEQEGDFLQNQLDPRDQTSGKMNPPADGFVLRFKK